MEPNSFSGRQWQWPAGLDVPEPTHRPTGTSSSTFNHPDHPTNASHHANASDAEHDADPQPQRPKTRTYKPRTCRICLEVVPPTTEIDESLAAGLFASTARVKFESEDPELGRLVSPCMCKGSQKYVHEGCLEAWRQAAPLSDRNFWQCPTCKFEYRLSRLSYGRWLSSKLLRVGITVAVMLITVFILGFVADPIINLWIDPLGSIADTLLSDGEPALPFLDVEDEPDTWWFHFLKGFFSLGLLGFLKTFLAMSPFGWFNVRAGVAARRRRGRDRMESINWGLIVIGIVTFLGVCTPAEHRFWHMLTCAGDLEVGEPPQCESPREGQQSGGGRPRR